MSKIYDVIICGCGPAGAAAGITLSRKGYSVVMLDRATFPRKKLCGGLLTWKSMQLLESVFGETVESLTEKGIINYASDQYAIRTFDNPLAEGTLPFPFHFVDRTVFDNHLLDHAKMAGAEVREGAKVVGCDPVNGRVSLADGEVLEGRYVIGADGANSVVRRTFPTFDRDRFRKYMAPALEISLNPEDFPAPVKKPQLYVGFLDAGYGWVFPNKDKVVLGICGLRLKEENFANIFEEYIGKLGVSSKAVPEFHGHPLPYGNALNNPVHGRTLLVGDAGGYVEPLFGEGLFFSMCTGFYAGEAVLKGLERRCEPGPEYASRLHRQIMPEINASDRLRWILFRAVKYIGPGALGLFVNAGANPLADMVHGIRSYSWLRKKEWDF